MNEIEAATLLVGAQASFPHNTEMISALKMGSSALREKAERENGCEFCGGAVPLALGKTNDYGIAIQYPNKLNAYGYDVHGTNSNGITARINFCPMCGKPLKPKEVQA